MTSPGKTLRSMERQGLLVGRRLTDSVAIAEEAKWESATASESLGRQSRKADEVESESAEVDIKAKETRRMSEATEQDLKEIDGKLDEILGEFPES